jgi:hypothetical protein
MMPAVLSHARSTNESVGNAQLRVNEEVAQEAPPKGKSELLNAEMGERLAGIALSFQPNVGQVDSRADFLARGNGYNLFLTPTGAIFDLLSKRADAPAPINSLSGRKVARQNHGPYENARVGLMMKLIGGNTASPLQAQQELPSKVNYFIGNNPKNWRSQIPTYGRISQKDVYAGVDLIYYGNQRQLEYDFVVAPGADYKQIRLAFAGADRIRIDGNGDILLKIKGGVVRQRKPFVYQETGGVRKEIACRYVILGKNEVGFKVGEYDSTKQLIIDPVLLYSTYLGGTGVDEALAVTANSSSVFISGSTSSATSFPVTTGVYQTVYGGGTDAFVAKLNHISESAPFFDYITYLGGSGVEHGYGIAADAENNAYVVGDTTSTNFPTTSGSFRSSTIPSPRFVDSFATKLNANGSALIYSTYIGGSQGYDYARDVAIDAAGTAYITGDTTSVDFPLDEAGTTRTTPGGLPRHFEDGFDEPDAFVLGLNVTGNNLIYTTFLGGAGRRVADKGYGIAVGLGNQFVTGFTSATTGFPLVNEYQSYGGGTSDVFVARLEYVDGLLSLRYSTYLGGNNEERGKDITVDSTGKLYLTGSTNSANFPTRNALQPVFRGGTCAEPGSTTRFVCHDVIVVKIDPYLSGNSSLLYSSFLGGRSDDLGNGITIDPFNNLYLTGETNSDDFPLRGLVPADSRPLRTDYTGAGDAFITKLNASGIDNFAYGYSAYLGEFFHALSHIAFSREYGNGIALDSFGNAYVVGQTASNRFSKGSVPFPSYGGNVGDGFVAKVQETPSDRMGSMMGMIMMLISDGTLKKDEGNDLLVKLEVATKQLDKGNIKPALNQLEAFIAMAEELTQSGALPSQTGKVLIDRAREIVNQLTSSKPLQ